MQNRLISILVLCSGLFIFTFPSIVFSQNTPSSATDYFQQKVNTRIQISLDDVLHEIHGNIVIEYHNLSPDTLHQIFLHLWGNAFKDQSTAFAKQQLRNRDTKFYFSKESEKGNFYDLDFRVNNTPVESAYWEDNIDILVLNLENPLKPGEVINISSPLHLKIPASFSRLGHVGTSYQMTQWFPKPAVYDRDGWHPIPYLTQGEFYSEFGSYDVSIELPENYYVAATGTLQTPSEIEFRSKRIEETKLLAQDTSRVPDVSFPESATNRKTIRFTAERVHDFAWFADKRFWIEKSNVKLSNNDNIDTWVFYTDDERKLWSKGIEYVDRAVSFYSEHVGNYPYPHATAVQSALSAGGGMEYPMITVIGLSGNALALDQVITHEVGHNWFYGILAFNERDYPWLDEGINSYYDHRYTHTFYEKGADPSGLPPFLNKKMETSLFQLILTAQSRRGKSQAPALHSEEFDMLNYGLSAYEKPAIAFEYLYRYIGPTEFDNIMKSFYQNWAFKHPGPQDLIQHFNANTDKNLDWFWDDIIGSDKEVDYALKGAKMENEQITLKVKNKGDVASPFPVSAFQQDTSLLTTWYEGFDDKATISFPAGNYDYLVIDSSFLMLDNNMNNNYEKLKGVNLPKIGFFTGLDQSKKRQLYLLPVAGGNKYDGVMVGLGLHNLTFPMPKLKGSIVSMYGFKSQKVVGNAFLAYDQNIHGKSLENIRYSIFSKQFSLDPRNGEAKDYGTIVPSINFHIQHDNTNISSDITIKNTLVRITTKDDNNTTYTNNNYAQILYALVNRNVILPSKFEIGVEHQKYNNVFEEEHTSLRLDATYSVGYQFMKSRFVRLRFFAAAIPVRSEDGGTYNQSNNISLVQNGQADYRFEDYYFGRDELEGFGASQILEKQGGFKIAGVFPHPFAQSDKFALSTNINVDLPVKKIGKMIGLYGDFGLYSVQDFQDSERTLANLYTAGVRLNFYDFIKVYFPVIQSSELKSIYGDSYFSSVSFSLDLNKFEPTKLYQSFKL